MTPTTNETESQMAAMREEIERLREALSPSGATKAAYNGEFSFYVPDDEGDFLVIVPWTTIKEIMATIWDRADDKDAALKEPTHD